MIRYLIVSLCTGMVMTSLFGSADEMQVYEVYASTPFDRCVEAFEGTNNIDQCEVLK